MKCACAIILVDDEANDACVSTRSLAIPDGLVMDPLAPTALAVSSEFMDRIGSGLTILRDHGKKVQKVGTYLVIRLY